MQSIRQYREIGRFVEHTHHQEDNRSKDAPDVSRKRTTLTLPLPNLGPDIEEQWNDDVEKQLDSCSSSQIWKTSNPVSSASSDYEKTAPDSGYSSNDEKSKPSSRRSSTDTDKIEPDSAYGTDNDQSKPPSSRTSSEVSSICEPNAVRFSALRPNESTEHILSHFSPYTSSDTIGPIPVFECPRAPPAPPATPVPIEQLERERQRIIPVHSYGPADPTNPRNWPLPRRSCAFVLICLLSFTQTWAGSADSSYNGAAAESLGVSRVAASLNTAMFSLGIGVGSLFVGPLSETFGRNLLYFIAGAGYLFGVMATALSRDLAGQVVSRLFVGLCTSVTGAVSGSSLHDMFDVKERSIVFPLLALMNTLPTALAPIPGGWICESARISYHWVDWISLIISAPAWLLAFLFLPETYSPLLQSWKAQHLRRVTCDSRYRSGLESGGGLVARLKETLPRPLIFWGREPVIIILGIYTVVLNVLLFIFLSAFEFIFTDTYGFSEGETGTVFLAIGAGIVFSTCLTPIWYIVDSRALRQRQIYEGPSATLPPEVRLWSSMIASPFMSISIFWLAWTNYPSISPWCGIAACFVFGYALIAIQVSSFQYIIDSYGPYAASAMGGITLARFALAAGMNVAARPMFEALGVHWTLTIVGSIAAVLIPAPWLFYKYGASVRARSKYAVYA
ncbi:putative major facilitator superfamily protein [Neofusicoccum parvum UCRNP2]|uniref:Putative major facilitator superfamily protein n=1 Tax=Botryosphaeria parva (strain UCR-NP2) TaxID=1287680 RepID=R1ENZ4_BOTPV|nr:putative major facilitator superfamily protein [Neofusicoccum parvum UCRNP2]